MPLVRYHIRNEYDLANPKLYTSAEKDDPEGLIEAVAIAGLVGIIRQLGDLAEFAAEVFNILHEEVLATASKGQELVGRVQQLEAELPSVEKETLSHSNHAILAYNPGMEWHATIQNDQNHFANGDLPRFIRNSCRKCRSPPRLHLLDKFDAAGSGACLKRYSDPSLFKTEWAITEIRKAEKEQEARRTRNFQRQEQQKEGSYVNSGSRSTLSRMPYGGPPNAHLHQASTSHQQPSTLEPKQDAASSSTVAFQTGKDHTRTVMSTPKREESGLQPNNTDSSPTLVGSQKTLDPMDVPSLQSSQYVCHASDAEPSDSLGQQVDDVLPTVDAGNAADDASETESFVDALATMESETETDSEMRPTSKTYGAIMSESSAPLKGNPEKQSMVRKDGFLSCHDAAEEYDKVETAAAPIVEDTPEVNPALPPDGNNAVGDQTHAKPKFPGAHVLREEKIGSAPTCKSHWGDYAELCDSPALTTNKNGATSSWISEASLTTKSATCSKVGQQIDSDSDTISECLRSHVAKVDPRDVLDGLFSESEAEKISPDDDTTSESTGRISPRTSGDSLIIKPIRWNAKFTRFHNVMLDTDEEMNVPSSTSSSALSSPRPSALATTVSDVDLRNDMMLRLFPDASNLSSLASGVGVSDNGPLRPDRVKFRGREPKLGPQPSSSGSILSSSTMGSSFGNSHGGRREESERFPPPPPLPPLKWRTARATKSSDESSRPKSAIFPSLSSAVPSSSSGIRFASDGQVQASGIDDPIGFMLPKNVPEPQAFKPFAAANRANLGHDHENSMRFKDAQRLASREGFEMSDESVKESVGRMPTTQMWHLKSEDLPYAVESANKVGYGGPLRPPADVEDIIRGSSQVLSSSGMQINGSASLSASRSEREIFLSPSHGRNPLTVLDESMDPVPVSRQKLDSHVLPKAGEDLLVVANADASRRRETAIPLRSQSSRMAGSDERENMLEQIRTGSFNLRHVKVERQDQARPVTSISVAAILEKANAIRQVCDPNIDDGNDGWSDDT